jgi:DNA mismatch repair protein MutL
VLSLAEQAELVRRLEQCLSPRTCPHGRPTMIHLSVEALEKQFGRRG